MLVFVFIYSQIITSGQQELYTPDRPGSERHPWGKRVCLKMHPNLPQKNRGVPWSRHSCLGRSHSRPRSTQYPSRCSFLPGPSPRHMPCVWPWPCFASLQSKVSFWHSMISWFWAWSSEKWILPSSFPCRCCALVVNLFVEQKGLNKIRIFICWLIKIHSSLFLNNTRQILQIRFNLLPMYTTWALQFRFNLLPIYTT